MIWLWIVLGVAAFLLISWTFVVSSIIYTIVLVRSKPEKWDRSVSEPDNEETVRLYADGALWAAPFESVRRDVSIISEGFRLCGEYFDFGSDRAVIIVPGRMEACRFSYHFAPPYQKAGYNVLVIDNRCHGLSEGKYNSVGFREYRDVLAWGKMLHDECGIKEIILHGVCIGSSTCLFAMTSKNCPAYFRAMAADGMYTTFFETFKNHMKQQGRPVYPFIWEIALILHLTTGARMMTDGPVKRVRKLDRPILFLHSREDTFSLPQKAETLFETCSSPDKQIVWFDHGSHSRIRMTSPDAYDAAVTAFLGQLKNTSECSASYDEALQK